MDNGKANAERFDALANAWDQDHGRVLMAQKIARAMRTTLQPAGTESALEFGAGTGLVTLLMAKQVAHLTAIDGSAGMLDVLRAKCALKRLDRVTLVHGEVPAAIPDARYDLIYSSMTLHHIVDVPALLQTLFAHLVPGGRVALADLDAEDGSFHGDAKGVAHHGFERGVFAQCLRDAGFVEPAFSTAHTVHREAGDGVAHDYPIFLALAQRSAS